MGFENPELKGFGTEDISLASEGDVLAAAEVSCSGSESSGD